MFKCKVHPHYKAMRLPKSTKAGCTCKGIYIVTHKKVYIYRNLHKDCWSIQYRGKVIGYAKKLELMDVEFRVRPGGYKKAQQTKTKNVHAFIIGRIVGTGKRQPKFNNKNKVTYSPFKVPFFVNKMSDKPVLNAEHVYMDIAKGVYTL